jgi:hypothetical protein
MSDFESQRDSIFQPSVATQELRWGIPAEPSTLKGLHLFPPAAPGMGVIQPFQILGMIGRRKTPWTGDTTNQVLVA